MKEDTCDAVDNVLVEWRRERPDLDVSPVGIVGRVSRLARVLERELKLYFAKHGLEQWEADVLFTLRRAGEPYKLTMGRLVDTAMVTSGAITNRIDRMEAKELVRRCASPDDRRSVQVQLTDKGAALADEVVVGHLANEERLLAALTGGERDELAGLLRKLLLGLGDYRPPAQ